MPFLRRVVIVGLIALGLAGIGLSVASAQALDTRPFILRLFGFGKPTEAPSPPPPVVGGPKVIVVPPVAPAGQPARPAPPAAPPKNADARPVLVFGDRLATDLARGLDVAFADSPDVAIELKVVEPSGLTDRQAFDWKAWLEKRLASGKRPAAAVVMLGLGEAAPIVAGERSIDYPSVDWETVYRARVDEVVRLFAERGVPLSWIGLVPVANAEETADLSYVDSLIRNEVTDKGATYVDVWEAFASAGAFSFNGPDMDGQDRQLRLKDGIGFSRSGARKLAFFAEQGLRRTLAAAPTTVRDNVSPDGLVELLNDPAAGGEDDLVTVSALKGPKPGTPLYQLVVAGEPLAPVTGRADDLASER